MKSADGVVDLPLGPPGSTANPKANPETLFASGYAACFSGALNALGRKAGVDVSESLVTATVTFGKTDTGFGLAVEIVAEIPGVDPEVAADLVEQAHQSAPTPRPPAATSSPRHASRDVMTKGLTTIVVSPFVIGGGTRPGRRDPRARYRYEPAVSPSSGAPG